MSDNESNKKPKITDMKRVLVFGGKTGWIGNLMCELMEKEGEEVPVDYCIVLRRKKRNCRRRMRKSFWHFRIETPCLDLFVFILSAFTLQL